MSSMPGDALLSLAVISRPWAELLPGLRLIAALALGLALASAAVSLVLRQRGRTPGMLSAQVNAWWVLLPPVTLAWALYPVGAWLLLLLISGLAVRDLVALGAPARRRSLGWCLAGLAGWQALLGAGGAALWASASLLALAAWQGWRWRRSGRQAREALLLGLFALQAAGLSCLLALTPASSTRLESASWWLYLCVVTALNDVGQFIGGKCFGRHKLASRISPNKTWQGLGGGLVFSALFSWLVGQALGIGAAGWLCALGLLLSVAGLLGDLMFSAGKRALGIKDYSQLIPGHGGMMDRVDSLVLTAPVLLLALRLAGP